MRYKVTLAYDGNNYVGFQSQKNGLAIQDVIEKALKIIFKEDIRIVMASRTDAGVHAKGQVFHFDTNKKKDTYKLKIGDGNKHWSEHDYLNDSEFNSVITRIEALENIDVIDCGTSSTVV